MPSSFVQVPLLVVLLITLLAVGCDKRESTPPAATSPSTMPSMKPKAEVKVLSDGSLFLNGQASTLEAIDHHFGELAKANGEVWYYREAGQSDPPPVATKVIDLVIKHRLPITMSSNPDFSDTIDGKGVSRPRQGR